MEIFLEQELLVNMSITRAENSMQVGLGTVDSLVQETTSKILLDTSTSTDMLKCLINNTNMCCSFSMGLQQITSPPPPNHISSYESN